MAVPITDKTLVTVTPSTAQLLIFDPAEALAANQYKRITVANALSSGGATTQTLVDGASVAFNGALGSFATLTTSTTGRTISAPTNLVVGQSYVLNIVNSSGSLITVLFNAAWKNKLGDALPFVSVPGGNTARLLFVGTSATTAHLMQTSPIPSLLTDAATVAWDAAAMGEHVAVALTASRVLGAISNAETGQIYSLLALNVSGGAIDLTFDTAYKNSNGSAHGAVTILAGQARLLMFGWTGAAAVSAGDRPYVATVAAAGAGWTSDGASGSFATVLGATHGRGTDVIAMFQTDALGGPASLVQGKQTGDVFVDRDTGDVVVHLPSTAVGSAPAGRVIVR